MGQPFIGEIRMVGFNFAPVDWAFCDGSTIAIEQNSTLFQLIGTTYGGDGETTFALPNLLGRVPIHMGNENPLGEFGGEETVTLSTTQIPSHTHSFEVSTSEATEPSPSGAVLSSTEVEVYVTPTDLVSMTNASTQTGGSQAHDNLQPYLCINFIISLFGVFPSQN